MRPLAFLLRRPWILLVTVLTAGFIAAWCRSQAAAAAPVADAVPAVAQPTVVRSAPTMPREVVATVPLNVPPSGARADGPLTSGEAAVAERGRLFGDAKRLLVCAQYVHGLPPASGPDDADMGPDDSLRHGKLLPEIATMDGMRPERDCVHPEPVAREMAMDELKRAAAMGDLDARAELAIARLSAIEARASAPAGAASGNEAAHAETSDEAASLRRELQALSMAGNRAAMFSYGTTLDSGVLGTKDPQLGKAWTMAAMQPSAGFDDKLVDTYAGYASATASEKAQLLKSAKFLYGQCCGW